MSVSFSSVSSVLMLMASIHKLGKLRGKVKRSYQTASFGSSLIGDFMWWVIGNTSIGFEWIKKVGECVHTGEKPFFISYSFPILFAIRINPQILINVPQNWHTAGNCSPACWQLLLTTALELAYGLMIMIHDQFGPHIWSNEKHAELW